MSQKPAPNREAMWDAYNRFHYLCDTPRFQKLVSRVELIQMISDVPGDVVDAGAFKGISTIQFAHMLQIAPASSETSLRLCLCMCLCLFLCVCIVLGGIHN